MESREWRVDTSELSAVLCPSAMSSRSLPIDAVLPEICDELAAAGALVLQAEPGAGKTTRVPAALLDAGVAGAGSVVGGGGGGRVYFTPPPPPFLDPNAGNLFSYEKIEKRICIKISGWVCFLFYSYCFLIVI